MSSSSHAWFETNSLSFELVKGLPTAAVALAIGLIAAGIAWQQWRVSRAKFKLDLFEQRYELYLTAWTFLSFATDEETSDIQADVAKFWNETPRAYFLFGEEIGAFFEEAKQKRIDYRMAMRRLRATELDDVSRPAAEARALALSTWFTESMEGLRLRFSPFLAFDKWR